jgi:hypothetical protein
MYAFGNSEPKGLAEFFLIRNWQKKISFFRGS